MNEFTPQLILLDFIITGIIYTVPVILFRKFTSERNRADGNMVAFVAALIYGAILSCIVNSVLNGELTYSKPPILWVLVCAYILQSKSLIFSKKKKPDNNTPKQENISVDEDGTITIEQPVEKQKYRIKKKLKILVSVSLIVAILSISLNIYLIYEPDEYVYCYKNYYHSENCVDYNTSGRCMLKSVATEKGYAPCPKCQK